MASRSEGDQSGESASPLGDALILLGDMWTIRIVRSIFLGRRRFQDLRDSLEISEPILSGRLRNLIDNSILETREYQTRPVRLEYLLTDAGLDLWRVLVATWAWDITWAGPNHRNAEIRLHHVSCGNYIRPTFGCGQCGAIGLTARDMHGTTENNVLQDLTNRRSRRSPLLTNLIEASGVLGDRWSTLILSSAFMGVRRFSDFQSRLQIPPVTLASRLSLFVETQMMSRESIHSGSKRQEYRLTPKSLDFFIVTTMINSWAAARIAEDGRSGLSLVHTACGNELDAQFTCNFCHQVLRRTEIAFDGDSASAAALSIPK